MLPLSRLCHLPSERPQILEGLYIQPSFARNLFLAATCCSSFTLLLAVGNSKEGAYSFGDDRRRSELGQTEFKNLRLIAFGYPTRRRRDYRNIADGLGGPLYGLCDHDAITPLCLGLI